MNTFEPSPGVVVDSHEITARLAVWVLQGSVGNAVLEVLDKGQVGEHFSGLIYRHFYFHATGCWQVRGMTAV